MLTSSGQECPEAFEQMTTRNHVANASLPLELVSLEQSDVGQPFGLRVRSHVAFLCPVAGLWTKPSSALFGRSGALFGWPRSLDS